MIKSPGQVDFITIVATNLEQNRQGVVAYITFVQFTIENCVMNGSLYQGVVIDINDNEKGTFHIINSSFTASGDRGLVIFDYFSRFSQSMRKASIVSGNTFSWNNRGAISYGIPNCPYYYGDFAVHFKSNHFFRNHGPTVELIVGECNATCVFSNNTFDENRGISVISVDSLYFTTHSSTLVVDGNLFKANHCPDKALIDIASPVRNHTNFSIKNNNFTLNSGRCVLLEVTATHVQISITNNLFNENYCENKSVIEFLRMDENATFENNTFTKNRAESVVLLQVIHDIHSWLQRKKVAFNHNTLSNNIDYIPSRLSTAGDSCAMILSGIPYYTEINFSFNKFNNSKYRKELCIRFPATSLHDVVNVTHNWWGSANESVVSDRISDFNDNYDFAIANDWPFLLSDDDSTLTAVKKHDFKQCGRVLSGRLFESITLKASHSPYIVTSDLTVLDNVTLSIEAGVTVKVSPGMSILVAGTLQAHGTSAKQIIFTVKEPASSNENSRLPVRLMDGDFPWEGRAEVFYNKSWKPISTSNNMQMRNITEVVCRQLGYGPPVTGNLESFVRKGNTSWLTEFRCHGNETLVDNCPIKQQALNYSSPIVVKCQGAPWGNLRFVFPRDVNEFETQSVLDHVEILHCGNRHGMSVPAIEAVTNTPRMESISIRNCTSGGVRIYYPETDVHLNNCTFVNTGEAGISFVHTRRRILIENCESSRNQRGVSFEEPSEENVPRDYYGRVFFCSDETTVFINNHTHLYFYIASPKNTLVSLTCQKVLMVTKGQGIKLTLLYFKGTPRLQIYDSTSTARLIVDRSYSELTALVHKELFIPSDAILVQWSGDLDSDVVILVEKMNINGKCLFEAFFNYCFKQ